jgi:CRP-like cAMP-binding protein
MLYPHVDSARHNRILAGIPLSHYSRMAEHLKPVDWTSGQVVCEPGDDLEFVYFPTTCTSSLVSHTEEGDSSELAMIGRDGMVGMPLVLGATAMSHRVIVHCAGRAYRMPAHVFVDELSRCRELQHLALCHVQALITQMAQSIVCIGHHSVSERLCCWLLFNADALPGDQLKVTHEMISNMLGVRRESVTQALGKLQGAGLVASGRGRIDILDRDGLASQVCECFAVVSSATRRLFERAQTLSDAPALPFDLAQTAVATDDARQQKYQDAYDFAPVGFVSLDAQGQVLQTNLAGAIMLDIQRSQGRPADFLGFIQPADQARFGDFHQEVLSGKCRRYCEVTLVGTGHRDAMVVRIDATLDDEGQECQLVLIDVTQEKREVAQTLERERQQQEMLARQPYMMWFKDPQGHLISANAKLIDQSAYPGSYTQLEKVDIANMLWSFSASQGPSAGAGA